MSDECSTDSSARQRVRCQRDSVSGASRYLLLTLCCRAQIRGPARGPVSRGSPQFRAPPPDPDKMKDPFHEVIYVAFYRCVVGERSRVPGAISMPMTTVSRGKPCAIRRNLAHREPNSPPDEAGSIDPCGLAFASTWYDCCTSSTSYLLVCYRVLDENVKSGSFVLSRSRSCRFLALQRSSAGGVLGMASGRAKSPRLHWHARICCLFFLSVLCSSTP